MATKTLIFTKKIETKRFTAVPGMAVPKSFSSPYCVAQLKRMYGQDCIKSLDYANIHEFLALTSGNPGELLKKADELAIICKHQAAEIKELRRENARLKSQQAPRSQ